MTPTAIAEIDQLNAERAEIYGQIAAGSKSADIRARVKQITEELAALWVSRRQEKRTDRDEIDLLLDREYERLYGADYEEAVQPSAVEEEDDRVPVLAA